MDKVIQHRVLLQVQRLRHGQDPLHEPAVRLTVTAKRLLAPQYPERNARSARLFVGSADLSRPPRPARCSSP
jgi:hypothetical protein